MMDPQEEILNENAKEYIESGNDAFQKKKYNVAVTLFFKAICANSDLFIFQQEGFTPTSHTDRFRIVQEKYSWLYDILDRDFPFYQDSYTQKMNQEAAEMLLHDVQRITKKIKY